MQRKFLLTKESIEDFRATVDVALEDGWEPVPGTLAITGMGDRFVGCLIVQRSDPEKDVAMYDDEEFMGELERSMRTFYPGEFALRYIRRDECL